MNKPNVAFAPIPAAPALWSAANVLVEATAPPYTADWMPAAIDPAATPPAVNPAAPRTKGAAATAAVPPTKAAAVYSFQHHVFSSAVLLWSGIKNRTDVLY